MFRRREGRRCGSFKKVSFVGVGSDRRWREYLALEAAARVHFAAMATARFLPRPVSRCLLLLTVLALAACGAEAPSPAPPPAPIHPPPIVSTDPPGAPSAARPPRATDFEVIRQAREAMDGGGREESCGPYRLWTDVGNPEILELCRKLAAPLDVTYQHRFGLRPEGDPAEGVFLFARSDAFSAFARRRGRLRAGYGGFSDGSKGFAALHIEGLGTSRLAQTLAHELTHLVSRRALGPGLPPWLSEGLADAIGDAAGEGGLGPLEGLNGVEGPAKRLRLAYGTGRVPGLERLAGLTRAQFDGGIVSYDYEQSALFVRYLLLSPALEPRFKDFLGRLARAERYSPQLLRTSLGRSWEELDEGLSSWLSAQ